MKKTILDGIDDLEQSLRIVKNTYNNTAQTYHEIYDGKVIEIENAMLQDILSKSVPNNETVLDAGCGTGLVLDLLDIHPALYTGMDFAQETLTIAKKKYPRHDFVLNDARFIDNNYDNIISTFALPDYVGLDWLNIASKVANKRIITTFCNMRAHITAFNEEPIVFRPSAFEIQQRCKQLNFSMFTMFGLGYDYLTDDMDVEFIQSEMQNAVHDLDNCKFIILMVNK